MSLFKDIKTKSALTRLQEEQVYEFILNELDSGIIRRGLMAKAMTIGNGDEGTIRGEYIKLRFQSLIDENTLMDAIESIMEGTNNQKPNNPYRKKQKGGSNYESIIKRQEDFSLKPIEKGNKNSFWDSLKDEFHEARRKDRDY